MCRRLVNVLVGISFREYSIILSVKVKNVFCLTFLNRLEVLTDRLLLAVKTRKTRTIAQFSLDPLLAYFSSAKTKFEHFFQLILCQFYG